MAGLKKDKKDKVVRIIVCMKPARVKLLDAEAKRMKISRGTFIDNMMGEFLEKINN